jgi:drug/metabolite transporter (DMT)-like permease
MRMNSTATKSRPTGIRNPWLHLAVSIACVTIYELLLKRGAVETANPNSSWSWTGLSGLGSIYVWIAIVFVILSLITWLYVLRYLPLSIAFPISQAVHVLVPLGSWLILGENIVTLRWLGIALVSLGLAIVAKPVARLEEEL